MKEDRLRPLPGLQSTAPMAVFRTQSCLMGIMNKRPLSRSGRTALNARHWVFAVANNKRRSGMGTMIGCPYETTASKFGVNVARNGNTVLPRQGKALFKDPHLGETHGGRL